MARRRRGNYCWSQPICSASRFVIRNSKTPREFVAEGNTLKGTDRRVSGEEAMVFPAVPVGFAEWRSYAGCLVCLGKRRQDRSLRRRFNITLERPDWCGDYQVISVTLLQAAMFCATTMCPNHSLEPG